MSSEDGTVAHVVHGVVFRGTFTVEDTPPVVAVRSPYGSKAAALTDEPPHEIAQRVFVEVITAFLGGP